MHTWKAVFIAATALCVLTASPALAEKGGNGRGKAWGHTKGTPGPIAGAGLPVLVAAGAYVLYRRRRDRSK